MESMDQNPAGRGNVGELWREGTWGHFRGVQEWIPVGFRTCWDSYWIWDLWDSGPAGIQDLWELGNCGNRDLWDSCGIQDL